MKPELGEKFGSEAPFGDWEGVWVELGDGVGGLGWGSSASVLDGGVVLGVMLGKIWRSPEMMLFFGVRSLLGLTGWRLRRFGVG